MKKIISILMLFTCLWVKAQNEYLTLANSVNCSYTKFDSIPNVHWISVNSSAIDENHHRYFFMGSPPNYTPSSLYIINTLTGGVINSYKMISGTGDSLLIGLEYDNNSDTLYGILEANSEQDTYFVWIDLTNGSIHSISTLPGQGFGIGTSTYDKNHHRYFYSDAINKNVIDVRTGHIIFSYPNATFHNYLIKYNNVTNKLYGLNQPTSQQFEFDSITVSTGVAHPIASMPFQSIVAIPVLKAMNETHGKYICAGQTGSVNRLYTIDINTGSIAYQPIDTLISNNSNLIEFQYDNVQDTLFALHWGNYISTGIQILDPHSGISIYPNPNNGNFVIEPGNTVKQTLQVYDVTGKMVLNQLITGKTFVDASSLYEGIYNISLISNEDVVNKKLVIVR